MTKTYHRRQLYNTTFRKLPIGARFRTWPAGNGPFVKSGIKRYEDARIGDDVGLAFTNIKVRRLWALGIEPN